VKKLRHCINFIKFFMRVFRDEQARLAFVRSKARFLSDN